MKSLGNEVWGRLVLVSDEIVRFAEKEYAPPARIVLNKECVRVGRAGDKEVILPIAQISSLHCEVRRDSVTDYSTNGTYINQSLNKKEPIRKNKKEKFQSEALRDGDLIAFFVGQSARIEYKYISQLHKQENIPATVKSLEGIYEEGQVRRLERDLEQSIAKEKSYLRKSKHFEQGLKTETQRAQELEAALSHLIDTNGALSACLNARVAQAEELDLSLEQMKARLVGVERAQGNELEQLQSRCNQVEASRVTLQNQIEYDRVQAAADLALLQEHFDTEKARNTKLSAVYEEAVSQALAEEAKAKEAEATVAALERRANELEKELEDRVNDQAAMEAARKLRHESALNELQTQIDAAHRQVATTRSKYDESLLKEQAESTRLKQRLSQTEVRLAAVVANAAGAHDTILQRVENCSSARCAADAAASAALASAEDMDMRLTEILEENRRLAETTQYHRDSERLIGAAAREVLAYIQATQSMMTKYTNEMTPILNQVIKNTGTVPPSDHESHDDLATEFAQSQSHPSSVVSPLSSGRRKRPAHDLPNTSSNCRRRLADVLQVNEDADHSLTQPEGTLNQAHLPLALQEEAQASPAKKAASAQQETIAAPPLLETSIENVLACLPADDHEATTNTKPPSSLNEERRPSILAGPLVP